MLSRRIPFPLFPIPAGKLQVTETTTHPVVSTNDHSHSLFFPKIRRFCAISSLYSDQATSPLHFEGKKLWLGAFGDVSGTLRQAQNRPQEFTYPGTAFLLQQYPPPPKKNPAALGEKGASVPKKGGFQRKVLAWPLAHLCRKKRQARKKKGKKGKKARKSKKKKINKGKKRKKSSKSKNKASQKSKEKQKEQAKKREGKWKKKKQGKANKEEKEGKEKKAAKAKIKQAKKARKAKKSK